MNKKAVIVTAETKIDYTKFDLKKFFFIGVERGILDLINKKIPVSLAIGDFDKVTKEELSMIKSQVPETIVFPQEKDYLDGELAIQKALEFQAEKIYFVAKPTKRYDKNLSIFDLVFKYKINFINDETVIFLLPKGKNTIHFDQYQDKKYVSFYAKQLTNLTIKQMKYNAVDLKLNVFENTCISNEFLPYLDPEIITDQDLICILSK